MGAAKGFLKGRIDCRGQADGGVVGRHLQRCCWERAKLVPSIGGPKHHRLTVAIAICIEKHIVWLQAKQQKQEGVRLAPHAPPSTDLLMPTRIHHACKLA